MSVSWPSFGFGTPWVLLLLLLLPLWWLVRRRRPPSAIVFSRAGTLAESPRRGQWVPRLLFLVRNLAIAGLVIALARPRSGGRTEESLSDGIDIVIAFDLSSSMLAEDFQPENRLEVARAKIKQFITMRKNDRIGVVAFSGEALTQVPLTTDYPVVLAAVDNLQPGQLEDGTAIGTAIATAANRLRSAPGRSRVIVLLTDGVNNRGAIDPRTAAQAAGQFRIKVYTIGVGTDGEAPTPVTDEDGQRRIVMAQADIDEKMLKSIADKTGGQFLRATDTASLEAVYARIDALEKTTREISHYERRDEKFVYALAPALALLALELGLATTVLRRVP